MGKTSGFLWGTATAAFQIEGALDEDGRGPSIWDEFCTPDRVPGGILPDIACDSYHRVEEDVKAMKYLGVNAYRFSIAWSRVMPSGRGSVNSAGLAYYHRLVDLLNANGITPMATLYHWDLPAALQHGQGGWLAEDTALDFLEYAKLCFREFNGDIPLWCTLNEPWCTAVLGYGTGDFAPGIVSSDKPYIAAHNQLLAHGYAVDAFRQGGFSGNIGLAANCDWREPLTDSEEDRAAAQRAVEFFYGWFGDPVVFGEYPECMRRALGKRLPEFTPEEAKMLSGSADYMGLNHYTTLYASAKPPVGMGDIGPNGNGGLSDDQGVYLAADPNWEYNDMQWGIVPWGFRKMLNWVGNRYKLPVYVTENGCACPEPDVETARNDKQRCRFVKEYTDAMVQAVKEDNCPVKGYFHWSLMDNYEWARGYTKQLGLFRCTRDTLDRIPKHSADVYREIIDNSDL